jgi:predicted nucleotide-binding protein (sugar kinase/HSP70/actin superfamily)
MSCDVKQHYRCPSERPFTAEQRGSTTILFGSLTPKHEALIQAVFRGSGYLCEHLPTPTKAAHETGKEFCNNGLCNPNYFTSGNLIEYLRRLSGAGLSPEEIAERYLYFSIGGCGPCRFGMYESEYRLALENAGFSGFRVLTFLSNKVIREGSHQPGLKYTVNFGLGMLNALNLGDLVFEMTYQIRPYEVNAGETDRVMAECVGDLSDFLASRCHYEVFEKPSKSKLSSTLSILGKIRYQLYGEDLRQALARVRERLNSIEIDRTRIRPIVKVTGEFFSAIAEGDANHNMFDFLEKEGAEVVVEPIAGIVLYWLHQSRMSHWRKKGIDSQGWKFRRKDWLFAFCNWFYRKQYHRAAEMLGGLAPKLTDQRLLANLAAPYYHPLARGGEGYLEVAKSLYHTRQKLCHMVLSLKPFGCMPSTQSDAVMAMVVARYPDMLFLPVETSADGEINALSRVQMVFGDARRKASQEFQTAVASTGRSLDEIRSYVAQHRELRRPFYRVPRQPGIAGTAAQFVQHVARRMKRESGV